MSTCPHLIGMLGSIKRREVCSLTSRSQGLGVVVIVSGIWRALRGSAGASLGLLMGAPCRLRNIKEGSACAQAWTW